MMGVQYSEQQEDAGHCLILVFAEVDPHQHPVQLKRAGNG
jgi:hypothetical protein